MIEQFAGRPAAGAIAGARLRCAAAIAAAVCLAAGTATAEVDSVELTDYWTVLVVDGTAYRREGVNAWNDRAPIAAGDLIGPYQSIETGAGSEVLLLRDDDIIRVQANTVIQLPAPEVGGPETTVVQPGGDASYAVGSRDEPSFEVVTPYLVAGIKGTRFAITENASRLSVTEGLIGLSSAGGCGSVDVGASSSVSVSDPCTAIFVLEPLTELEIEAIDEGLELALNDDVTGGIGLPLGGGGGPLNDLTETLNGAAGGLGGAVGGAVGAVGDTLGGAAESLGGAAESLGGAAGGAVGGAADSVGGTAGNAAGAAGDAVGGAADSVGGAAGDAAGAAGDAVGGAVDSVGGAVGGLL